MNVVTLIFKEIIGTFIDDEFLAIAVLIVVALAAALAYVAKLSSPLIGATLFVGCVAVMFGSVWRAHPKT